MTPDSLVNNPFNMLGVSIHDSRDQIATAYEDALVAGRYDEAVLQKAQQTLMNPRTRLDAELAWMPELVPADALSMIEQLQRKDLSPADADRLLEGVKDLARINLAAALCRRLPGVFGRAVALVNAYRDMSPAWASHALASARKSAGFPSPDPAMLDEALARLTVAHARIALDCLTAAQHPGRAMTEIVRLRDRGNTKSAPFIDDIVRQYDQWSAPHLRKIEDAIASEIKALRDDPGLIAPVAKIEKLLLEWDEYSQPAQLVAQAKGLDEPRSAALIGNLRELCLWMANEKHVYSSTLTIAKAILHSFSELPLVARQLPTDIETLESLAAQEEQWKRFRPLYDALERAIANIKGFGADVARRGFGPKTVGLAKEVYDGIAAAAATMGKGAIDEAPWTAMRALTLSLHNEHKLTTAAHIIVIGLLDFAAVMPAETSRQFREDEKILRKELKMAELLEAAQNQNNNSVIQLADEVLALTADLEERKAVTDLKGRAEQRKTSGARATLFFGAVVAVIIIVVLATSQNNSSSVGSSSYPSSSYTPPDTYNPAPTYTQTPTPLPSPDDTSETPPAAHSTSTLTPAELRFCLFQQARLDYIRDALTPSDGTNFNSLVDDWNSRCVKRQYWDRDENTSRSALLLARPRLKTEAEALLRKWRTAPIFGSSVDSAPTIVTAANSALLDLANPAAASQIQQRLKDLGYYDHVVDGVFGANSRSALKAYKIEHSLGSNDAWDMATQQVLFSPQ
jgi:hypothetical protein